MALPETLPFSLPTFVGREKELRWLEEHVFFRERWHTAIFITGLEGVGKTALLREFFNKGTNRIFHARPLIPIWIELSSEKNPYETTNEFIEELYNRRFPDQDLIIVIDGADHLTEKQLEHITSRLFNLKAVRSVLITRQVKPNLERADVLALEMLPKIDATHLLQKLLTENLPSHIIADALNSTLGSPLALSVLADILKLASGQDLIKDMAALLKGQLYDISNVVDVPPNKIIPAVAPKIISASEALIEQLKKQPDDVYNLHPRKFEELLAELLTDKGWDVQLTKATRDGGKDILAYLNTDMGRLLFLIEAKKYRRDRKIGVDLVRSLYGTLCDHKANSAVLVTTSSFTPDAHDFQRKYEYQLALRDYGHLVQWIQCYKQKDKPVAL